MAVPVFDASSQGFQGHGGSLTVSHTVSGSDRVLYAFSGGAVPTGVTYNGTALSLVTNFTTGSGRKIAIWRLIAPATGTHNIVWTYSGGGQQGVGVGVSYTGVDQTTPETDATSNRNEYQSSPITSGSYTIVTDGLALGCAFNSGADLTSTSTEILLGDLGGIAKLAVAVATSGTSMAWTWTGGAQKDTAWASFSVAPVAGGDTTAPTLTSPTGTQTGSTTGSGTVTTDEANGTLYSLATTNSTETAATVKASGATQTISSTGVKNVTFTGLTASTAYFAHYVHRDAAGNDSTRVSSSSFTTTAGGTAVSKIVQQHLGA